MTLKTKRAQSIGSKWFSLIAVATLAACGGGGGGDDAPAAAAAGPTAEGVYGGTLTGGSGSAFELLVLENGDFWTAYGTQTAAGMIVEGFIQGNGTSDNGTFTSTSTKDFGFAPAKAATINATYNATAKTISGTGSITGLGSVSFSGSALPSSTYDYNTPATMSTITGHWEVTDLEGDTYALNIGTDGNFSGTGSGCNFTGNMAPRPSGKNVFNVTLTFGGAPCALPGQSASGIALASPIAGGHTQLQVVAVDSSKQYGAAVAGTR